jgi:hypothetical protein
VEWKTYNDTGFKVKLLYPDVWTIAPNSIGHRIVVFHSNDFVGDKNYGAPEKGYEVAF